jgi:AbrB family looped-hinge helix DNA binding protein
MKAGGATAGYTVSVAERGRLVLPAEVRRRLNIRQGDQLALLLQEDGTVKLQTRAVVAHSLRGMYKHLANGRSVVDELIAERRREAKMEGREVHESLVRARRSAAR